MNKSRVTITDVAIKAGVSKMTVSRVINQKGEISDTTRRNVLQAMEELGYRPNRIARSLATDTTLRIGIMVPSLANQYFGEIVEGAESVLWENDYHILLGHTGGTADREQAVMDIFEDHRVDGVIVLSAHNSQENVSQYLRSQRAAVVINTNVKASLAARMFTNELKSMAIAVNHLLKSGRRHPGYVHLGVFSYASRERYRGFELALNKAELPFDAATQTSANRDGGRPMTNVVYELLQANPQMDSLVCYNTGIAARALQACAQLGRRVPDDIAIVGYDDSVLAELTTPSLTTMDLVPPKYQVGATAARLLLERIEDSSIVQDDVILEHKLVVRDSAP